MGGASSLHVRGLVKTLLRANLGRLGENLSLGEQIRSIPWRHSPWPKCTYGDSEIHVSSVEHSFDLIVIASKIPMC